jgi:elongation factor G
MMTGSSKGRPFLCLTVSAMDRADDERLQKALAEIASSNPRISVNLQPPKVSHTVEGESKSLLDSTCDRLRNEYQLAINVDGPKPVLLETIRESGEGEGKYIRQVGGLGNYGHCKLRIEPNKPGEGYSFVSLVSGDVLRDEYVSSVDRGVQVAMQSGILHGHPLVDLKVTLIDGSYHAEDSNPKAFEIAGSTAFQCAAKKASPILLEPVMAVEIEVSDALTGTIEHEINRHRGRIKRKKGEKRRSVR